jgi:hypothetical protein
MACSFAAQLRLAERHFKGDKVLGGRGWNRGVFHFLHFVTFGLGIGRKESHKRNGRL